MSKLYRRPDSSLWWCEYSDRGHFYRESTHTNDERKGRAFLDERLRAIGAGQLAGARMQKLSLRQLCSFYLKRHARSPSYPSLVACSRRLLRAFPHARAMDLEVSAISGWCDQLSAAGLSEATVNRHLALLRAAYRTGQDHGLINWSPRLAPLFRQEAPARQSRFSHDEFLRLCEHLQPSYKRFVAFLYWTGMRVGQAGKIELRDVDLGEGTIRCRAETAKNREPYVLPLAGSVAEIVDEAWRERRLNCPTLFHDAGTPMIYQSGRNPSAGFRAAWKAALSAAGLGGRRVHDLRRSAATNLAAAGVPEAQARLITGHKTPGMYERYNIKGLAERAAALEKTAAYLARVAM